MTGSSCSCGRKKSRALPQISLSHAVESWLSYPITSQYAKRQQLPFKNDKCPTKWEAVATFCRDGCAKCEICLFNLQRWFEPFRCESRGQHIWWEPLTGTELTSAGKKGRRRNLCRIIGSLYCKDGFLKWWCNLHLNKGERKHEDFR